MTTDTDWERVTSEVLSCLRADRSQQKFGRLLQYRSNVASHWECGRRFPTATRTLMVCERVGGEVWRVMREFAPHCASSLGGTTASTLNLVGSTPCAATGRAYELIRELVPGEPGPEVAGLKARRRAIGFAKDGHGGR